MTEAHTDAVSKDERGAFEKWCRDNGVHGTIDYATYAKCEKAWIDSQLYARAASTHPLATSSAEPVAKVSADKCARDVYEHGQSIGYFDIPKETANAICEGINSVTGARVDWHYFAGRVHMKALAATPIPREAATVPTLPDSWLDDCMATAHQWAQAAYCKALNKPGQDIDTLRNQLRNDLRLALAAKTASTADGLEKQLMARVGHIDGQGYVHWKQDGKE